MHTLKLAAVSGLLALSLSATHTTAATPGSCPGGPADWELWTVSDLLSLLGLPEPAASMDPNSDGWTCVRFQELANRNKGWTAVIYRDNTVRD